MPQSAYDKVRASLNNTYTIEYFVHASDVTNGRRAGYAGYVVQSSLGVFYAYTAYGSLGTSYRTTDLGSFVSLDKAKKEVDDKFRAKLKKNYKEDTYRINQTVPQSKPNPAQSQVKYGHPNNIVLFSHYTPGQLEIPQDPAHILNEKVAFEWYPNRMRFKIYSLNGQAIGVYDISGKLESTIPYPPEYDNKSKEFLEIANNGLLFLGYTDPNDNIVLLRYISEGLNQRSTDVTNYSKQRNILLMIMYTLTDSSGISITSVDSPIYVNPRIVLSTDKEEAINNRNALNRFANNLVVFEPDDNMTVLNCIER